jgi:hypothetical protein
VCFRTLPEIFGAPQFIRINFAKKAIIGTQRTTETRVVTLKAANRLGRCNSPQSAHGDIHRDFKTETHVGISWCGPGHG